ncbi:immunoglobulin-binding protein 1 isoform X1 [Anolis sagrei]|uniref:immunoglobulin-binding protein 1 isoform X1 n=1 Tax=Anolis sagrei TaxID=38937 RepID=UPI003521D1E3
MAAPEEDPDPPRLSELLERGWRLAEEAEAGAEGPAELQRKVQAALALLEQAQRGVEALQLFSGNEELEEVASLDLRFLLVPALLGSLVLKQSPSRARLEQLGRARALFLRFLRQCKAYGLLGPRQRLPLHEEEGEEEEEEAEQEGEGGEQRRPPSSSSSGQAALLDMAAHRREKIDRYKAKKDLEAQLEALRPAVEEGRAEEEALRHFYLLQIQKWVAVALEEVEGIDRERALLERRGAMMQGPSPEPPSHRQRPPVMKPFILTRDAAQAKVFGAGYPSLATMTVDDWYEQHRRHGLLPDQGHKQRPSVVPEEDSQQQEEEKKEEEEGEEEEEEEEALRKARQWDDWKDSHPRGYGNRKNMG